jgi:PST family polysaccharide transporter
VFNKLGPSIIQLQATLKRTKTLLHDSWPLIISSTAIMVYVKIDQIMLGQMIGDEAVGIYSAAVRISEAWYFIPMGIVASVFPTIVEAKNRSETEYYAHLQKLYNLMTLISIAVAIPMTFLSTPLVVMLFGDAYIEAGAVLAIHIWASVPVFLGVASGTWFLAENRLILRLQRSVIGAITNVILNLALIPNYGVIGAAVATIISYSLADIFLDFLQKKTRHMFFMKIYSFNIFRGTYEKIYNDKT